jgi:unsaturated chondroitin disaccharide hydrolase
MHHHPYALRYNPDTGAVKAAYTYQGYADNSTWARGQAWALTGFAMLASAQRDAGRPHTEFLGVAQRIADRYLALLMEQAPLTAGSYVPMCKLLRNGVKQAPARRQRDIYPSPYWSLTCPALAPAAGDFNAPYDAATDGPRDTSAAAVAALGLLHLAELLGTDDTPAGGAASCSGRYLCAAANMLRALSGPRYLATPGGPHAALFRHATGNLPDNDKIDVGLVYADYYGLAALAKCAGMPACAGLDS